MDREVSSATPAQPSPLSLTRAWSIVAVVTLVMAVSYIDRQTLAALAPTVTRALGISDQAYGWLQASFSFAYLIGAPLMGRWIDRAGARRGLFVSMLIWSLVAALHSLVPGLATLFALRIALGLAESPGFPAAAQTVQRVLPKSLRSAGFGLLFTGSSIGAAVTPVLAINVFLRHYGWQGAFLGTAAIGLLWLPLWYVILKSEPVRAVMDHKDDQSKPSNLLALVRNPAVLRAVIAVVSVAPTIAFGLLWSSKFLEAAYHVPQRNQAKYLWLPAICFDLGSIILGVAASRSERRTRSSIGTGYRSVEWSKPLDAPHRILFAIGSLCLITVAVVPYTSDPSLGFVIMGIASFGGGGLFALLTADMVSRVTPNNVSAAGGMTAAAQSLAYILANPTIGRVVQQTHQYSLVLVGLAIWAVPGCLVWLLWTPPPRFRDASESEILRSTEASGP